MDYTLYHRYLNEYVAQAIRESDGTPRGIYEQLATYQVGGLFTAHKDERRRALSDARHAFDEHRHWPLDIILSQLGVKV
jgi:hypothetical protein